MTIMFDTGSWLGALGIPALRWDRLWEMLDNHFVSHVTFCEATSGIGGVPVYVIRADVVTLSHYHE